MSHDPTSPEHRLTLELERKLEEEQLNNASSLELFLNPKTRGRAIRATLWAFLIIVLSVIGLVAYLILAGQIVFE